MADEEQDYSELSSGEDVISPKEVGNKRKFREQMPVPLKKVKYEDITSDRKNKSKNELYKPPTVEELNELKETQNLYNNNLFRLQIEQLIMEVKIKNKHRKVFTEWYDKFQTVLKELPEHSVLLSELGTKSKKKSSEINKFISGIIKSIKCDQDFIIKCQKPEDYELFGLDSINTLPGPKLSIDINLKMPRAYFNVKDYLNNRYFVKRYCYLAYIAYYLNENQTESKITWIYHKGDNLLPIIQINLNEKVSVNIFATPTENYFRPSRFSADINNVKVDVLAADPDPEVPTLFYNASLAHDVTLTTNFSFIKESLSELNNAQEAIKLIHVWLTQRELNVGLGAFTTDLILYFIVYLLSKKRINKHMSSYQIIRNFWNFINETDLNENPISLTDSKLEDLETFKRNYDVVFLDKTGYYNVTAWLSYEMYKKIQSECGIAFKLLDNGGINSFHSLFITKVPIELQYDLILTLKSDSNFENIIKKMTDENRTKYLGCSELFVIKYIGDVLRRGFNLRASLIVPILTEKKKILFGVNLDESNAFNILERGPALNDPKEREFKEFWGDLATDRRFKDGSVCVAVYFKTETVKERRDIIQTIVNWVVKQKLALDYELQYNDFEDLLINKKVTAAYPMGTNEECCIKVISASDDLAKKLRGLEMPLSITGVQGISDTFSLTEVFPPISTSYRSGNRITTTLENNIVINEKRITVIPRYVKPIECVLQLGHSSKWPKDLTKLRYMKTAFYLEISKLLLKKHKIVSSVKPEYIDVLHEGYVFRYRLYIPREVGLLKKESDNNGVTVYKETPESREIEMNLNILPKVVGALKGLQSQHPSFGPATALIKRWLRSQLLDNYHFPDDVINLLSASLYLNQSEYNVPSTPQIGFLRFLKFFAEFQWEIQAVIVNFNDELSKETIAELDSKLLQNREAYPNVFVAMLYDGCESLCSKTAPSKEVLWRVKQLAGETLNHVAKVIKGENLITVKNLFIPNLEGYNVVIYLRPLLNPVRHEQVIREESEGQIVLNAFDAEESLKVPVTDFNPVQCYLKELRSNYGEFANFFHDTYGGNVIGVLWIPKALESKDFKVSYVNGRKLQDGKLVLNVDSLIEDFYILGKGLVKSIDKKNLQ